MAEIETNGSGQPFWKDWIDVYFHPSVESQEKLLAMPGTGGGKVLLWMAILSVAVVAVQTAFIALFFLALALIDEAFRLEDTVGAILVLLFIFVIFSVLTAAAGIAWLLGAAGFPHLLAKLLGGEGSFSKTLFITGSILTPLTILYLLPFLNLAAYPLAMYGLFLEVLAIRAVHKSSWVRSSIAALVPAFLVTMTGFFLYFAYLIFVIFVYLFGNGGMMPDFLQTVFL